jgi:hypothetical protein
MNFSKRQEFPIGKNAVAWMQECLVSNLQIDKQTKIASMGSCFAREIRDWLIKNGFNYVTGENEEIPWESIKVFTGDNGRLPWEHASIAWERVYNTFTIKHIMDYTFNCCKLEERLLKVSIGGKFYIADIVRNRILYKDVETAQKDILQHVECSKRILSSVDLLIVTLGLTEIWESKKRGIVVAANPCKHYKLPDDFVFRTSKYQENLDNLNFMYDLLKQYNSKIKILVTVSPISLLQTFRSDVDVITANCESKSILRVVAGEFANKEDVYYFSSYEIATAVAALDSIKMCSDGHHISKELIGIIMNVFNRKCVA